MEDTIKNYFDAVASIATTLAIIIGGFWAWTKFIRQREAFPNLDFDIGVNFVGKQNGYWVTELIASIENKGLVRHIMDASKFSFYIRYIAANSDMNNVIVPATNNPTFRLRFEHKLKLREEEKKDGIWLPWNYTYIEPGTIQHYRYTVSVPDEATFILFHSRFKYGDAEMDFHTAEKVFRVPE